MENPPNKFFRLKPGGEVRLKYAYIIQCESFLKDDSGNITEIHCSYQPDTRSGLPESNKKVKGTLHWISAEHALEAEIRLYDRLFTTEDPEQAEEGQDFKSNFNPGSLKIITGYCEPSFKEVKPGDRFQFERLVYFCVDPDSNNRIVFNRTATLKDNWARISLKS